MDVWRNVFVVRPGHLIYSRALYIAANVWTFDSLFTLFKPALNDLSLKGNGCWNMYEVARVENIIWALLCLICKRTRWGMRCLELIFDIGVSKASSCCLDSIIDFSTKVVKIYAPELVIGQYLPTYYCRAVGMSISKDSWHCLNWPNSCKCISSLSGFISTAQCSLETNSNS